MDLHIDDEVVYLSEGDTYVILPGKVHLATSSDETLAELYIPSRAGRKPIISLSDSLSGDAGGDFYVSCTC